MLFGLLLALGGFLAWRDQSSPAVALRFQRADAAPANATVVELPYREVHRAAFLEDHLDTAVQAGNSTEALRGRVQVMESTLRSLTGQAGPVWWVRWDGALVEVTLETLRG